MTSSFFSDDFLDKLPDDQHVALMAICQEYDKLDGDAKARPDRLDDYLIALAIFKSYANKREFPSEVVQPTDNPDATIKNIRTFFNRVQAQLTQLLNTVYLEQQMKKYTDRFGADSAYVFSDDDFQEIQNLINQIRDLITSSEVITVKHKRRLLERLERMQKELHKSTSDLDRFWGFIGEAGIALGKFGNDVKPLVDRIKDLANIVWKVVAIKELLLDRPSPISFPELPPKTDDTVAT